MHGTVPAHSHTVNSHNHSVPSHAHTAPAHTHSISSHYHTTPCGADENSVYASINYGSGVVTTSSGRAVHLPYSTQQSTIRVGYTDWGGSGNTGTGGGSATTSTSLTTGTSSPSTNQVAAQNINVTGNVQTSSVQPYITCYMWKRIS